MDLIVEDSGGPNIVAREMALPEYYAPATVAAREVEVLYQLIDDAGALIGVPISLGRAAPTAAPVIPYNPTTDRRARVYVMPYGPDGTPGYSSLRDCPQFDVNFQRETDAPVVIQAGEATNDQITLAVTGYTPFAVRRKLRVADDSAMTVNESEEITTADTGGLSNIVVINRTDGGAGTKTIYVRVSHSSSLTGAFGAESAAVAFTFADSGGTGGTTGDGDPYGRQQFEL
jgi:hypothetical protein